MTLNTLTNKQRKNKNADSTKPESLTMPQVLSKLLGIVTHSSWWHTQSFPWMKKYLLFQFLLELGMSDTNLSDFFLVAKWYIPLDEEKCWGL